MHESLAQVAEGRPPPVEHEAVTEGAGDQLHAALEEALGVTREEIGETAQRVGAAFEGINCADLNEVFDTLSDPAKLGIYRLLFEPSILSSQEGIDGFIREVGDRVFREISDFESGLPPQEHAALKRACLVAK